METSSSNTNRLLTATISLAGNGQTLSLTKWNQLHPLFTGANTNTKVARSSQIWWLFIIEAWNKIKTPYELMLSDILKVFPARNLEIFVVWSVDLQTINQLNLLRRARWTLSCIRMICKTLRHWSQLLNRLCIKSCKTRELLLHCLHQISIGMTHWWESFLTLQVDSVLLLVRD